MTKDRKHFLIDEQIETMRNAIFKKRNIKGKSFIRIPNSFMERIIKEEKETYNWKGQVLLTYIGIIICYKEARYTYRKHHMSVEDIMGFIGVKSNNIKVRKAFARNSWIVKNEYVNKSNELPHSYEVVDNKIKYNTTLGMTKEEINEQFANMSNRQIRSIEPVRHTKGLRRVRGRGFQIIEYPIDSPEANDYFTINYDTIFDYINGLISITDIYVLCCLKYKTRNGYLTRNTPFKISYNSIGKMCGLSENTILKVMKSLTRNYPEAIKYKTTTKNIKGSCKSQSSLSITEYLV